MPIPIATPDYSNKWLINITTTQEQHKLLFHNKDEVAVQLRIVVVVGDCNCVI